jgi:site-specific DNA recombinase
MQALPISRRFVAAMPNVIVWKPSANMRTARNPAQAYLAVMGYWTSWLTPRPACSRWCLLESLDRLSRDQEDLAGLFKRLSFLGVEILTANDGKADHVSIGVRGLLGALYLKDLADKTRRGLAGKVEAGQSAGGKAYGYRPVPGQPGQLEIVEEEAEIVRRIYEEYAAGRTPRAIAYDLNRDNIPAPRGLAWNASTINGSRTKGTGILRVDLYRGRIVWNKLRYIRDPSTGKRVSRPNPKTEWRTSEAPHLRLVNSQLWEKVHARLGGNARTHRQSGRPPSRRLLSGLLRCASCGGPMTIYGAPKGNPRVQCVRSRENGICDHRRTYSVATLEQGVVTVLRKLLSETDSLKTFVDSYAEERRRLVTDIAKRRNRAEGELAKAKAALSRMEDNLIWGNISREKFESMKLDLYRRIALAEADLARTAEPPKLELHPEAVRAYKGAMDTLHAVLASEATARNEELMQPIRALLKSVVVHPTPPDAPMHIELFGNFAVLAESPATIIVVAGAGFEPATFRL